MLKLFLKSEIVISAMTRICSKSFYELTVYVQLKEADQLITESLERFPNGSLFHVMGSHCARKQCNVEKGIKVLSCSTFLSLTFEIVADGRGIGEQQAFTSSSFDLQI